MPKKRVQLLLGKDSISTVSYENFDWKRFVAELQKEGLEITREQEIPCG